MPIYFTLFDMLHEYIYGLDVLLTPDMELTLTIISTFGSLFVVSLPFLLVWQVIKLL